MSETISKSLRPLQLRELRKFASRINKFGINFAVCDNNDELVLLCESDQFQSEKQQLIEVGKRAVNREKEPKKQTVDLPTHESNTYNLNSQVRKPDRDNKVLAKVLKQSHEAVGTALIDLGDSLSCIIRDTQHDMSHMIFNEMLELLSENLRETFKAEQQIEKIGTELAQTYEELVLLHKLSTNMKVTEQDANFLQMACDSLTEIVFVEGIAILLEKTIEDEKKLVVAAGSGLIDLDERMAAILHSRLTDEINSGKEALLDSEVDSPFKYDWPENIKNMIAVPLFGKEKPDSSFSQRIRNDNCIIGLMVAINRIDKQDFDSTDVKLFNSVANGCAVFIENGRLFSDLKELFIGSLKALTSSIDAKDKYTRGHSERVAFISRWIAERLTKIQPLEEEQIRGV